MSQSPSLNESLHSTELLKKGDFFLQVGNPCTKIGKLEKGILRGFVFDNDGDEVTTHFYQEDDMIVGSYIPNVNISMTIQALEDCEISVANYSAVMSQVNKNQEIRSSLGDSVCIDAFWFESELLNGSNFDTGCTAMN